MPDLHWQEGPVHCTDLMDAFGKVFGYVGPCSNGVRGYVVQSGSEWPPRPAAFTDHADAEAARSWVEAEVARRSFRPIRVTEGPPDA
ncbi:hypothetical protein MKK67_12425 [Methylobacterium sp. J-072]|nr:hypothetical protein [Methylobacterium sp. J-072]